MGMLVEVGVGGKGVLVAVGSGVLVATLFGVAVDVAVGMTADVDVGADVGVLPPAQSMPFTRRLVGVALAPLYEAWKPKVVLLPAATWPFQAACVTCTFWPD